MQSMFPILLSRIAQDLRSAPVVVALVLAATLFGAQNVMAQADTKGRGVIELMNQMEALNTDLNRLRGQIEILHNSIDAQAKRQKDMYLDLDSRLRRLEQDGSPEAQAKREKQLSDLDSRIKRLEQDADPAKRDQAMTDLEARLRKLETTGVAGTSDAVAGAPPTSTSATVPAPTPPTAPVAPVVNKPANTTPPPNPEVVRRAYDIAMNQYKTGNYQGSAAAFEAFVKRYPTDALASNAQYWVGDSYFNLLDFRAAAHAQQSLLKNYPDSAKVPDAMLNLGSAHAALNEVKQARQTLEELIAKHPSSEAAEKARQRLARLR